MTRFQEFDSFEEAIESMARATDEANANLAPEQAALTEGSTWARFDGLVTGETPLIVGHVHLLAQIGADEAASYGTDAAAQEDGYTNIADAAEQVVERYRENLSRGYLFGTAYSQWEPRGELGDTHRANAWPISPELFKALESVQFDLTALVQTCDPIYSTELQNAFASWRNHELRKARQLGVEKESDNA